MRGILVWQMPERALLEYDELILTGPQHVAACKAYLGTRAIGLNHVVIFIDHINYWVVKNTITKAKGMGWVKDLPAFLNELERPQA